MTGFVVVASELRAHADRVDGHAATMGQAADAADYAMSDGTYGMICRFLPPLFNDVEQAGKEALTASQGGLTAIARHLRAAADSYENRDHAAGLDFRGIGDGLR